MRPRTLNDGARLNGRGVREVPFVSGELESESGPEPYNFLITFYDRHLIFSFNLLDTSPKLGAKTLSASTPSRLLHEPVLPSNTEQFDGKTCLVFASLFVCSFPLMYSCQHSIFISPRFTPPGAKRNKTSEGEGGYTYPSLLCRACNRC